jgi:hypothetical protein
VEDDPAEEEDDFEVGLEAVDDFSFALAVVPLGFKALVFDSILAAPAPETWLKSSLMSLFDSLILS